MRRIHGGQFTLDKNKIKIVRIIARLNIGGPAINACILSSMLDKGRFATKVIYGSLLESEGSLEHLLEKNGVEMEFVPELGREISAANDIKALWKIFKILRRERPDIVHTHTAKAGTLGRIAAVCAGVKIRIHTFHGNIFKGYFSPLKAKFFVLIEKFLGIFTDVVIAISPEQKRELTEEFKIVPPRKCTVIPLGIDFSRLSINQGTGAVSGLRRELGLGSDDILVGIVGRLTPIKNHDMLLEAASRIRKNRPDIKAKYIIIGDGELKGSLEKAATLLGINDIVYFLGWREDLGNLYDAFDIVALTSLNEGTPLALIEAMAMKKAVVATKVGGVSDIVSDGVNGMLVGSGDINAFTGSLERLMDDKDLRIKMGEEGYAKRNEFSKENLAKRTEELYTRIIKEKKI